MKLLKMALTGVKFHRYPPLQGVWANQKNLENCRFELREALSDWLALRLRLGLSIPIIENLNLNQFCKTPPTPPY